jgi:hypothetical protein
MPVRCGNRARKKNERESNMDVREKTGVRATASPGFGPPGVISNFFESKEF